MRTSKCKQTGESDKDSQESTGSPVSATECASVYFTKSAHLVQLLGDSFLSSDDSDYYEETLDLDLDDDQDTGSSE